MKIKNIGFALLVENVKAASDFYTTHFGFKANAVLGWYASHSHPDQPGVYLDLIKSGHVSAGKALQETSTSGIIIALLVDDIDAEYVRLKQEGLTLLTGIQVEPWGQTRFQIQAPDGVVVELIKISELDKEWLKTNP